MAPQPFSKFDLFWANYPRRCAKGDARKAFAKLNPDDALFDRMIAALEWQRESEQWTRDDGQYIPYPATWLRAERWDDEPVAVKSVAPKGHPSKVAQSRDAVDIAFDAIERQYADQGQPGPTTGRLEAARDRDWQGPARSSGLRRVR